MRNLIEVMHLLSSKLSIVKSEEMVYEILYDGLKMMFPDIYTLIAKIDPKTMNFKVSHTCGIEKYLGAIRMLLGKDLLEMEFPMSDISEERLESFKGREFIHFKDGLYDVVNGRINKPVCKAIENVLGLSEMYAVSLCIDKKYFGALYLFVPTSTNNEGIVNRDIIYALESIAFQASAVINRMRDIKHLKQKEDELIIAQTRYNQLVSKLDDIVWKSNGDCTGYVDMNNSFKKYYGYSDFEFNNNPNLWMDIVHPEDKQIALKAYEVLQKKGASEAEYRIVRADGKTIWVHDRTSAIFDENGTPIQFGGIVSEITEKKYLEEQLRLKDYAYQNSSSATAFCDLNGYHIYANKAYADMFGYSHESEVIGKHVASFASSSEEVMGLVSEMLSSGETYSGYIEPKRKDNSTFYSYMSASPVIHDGKTLCLMAVFVDVTELKQMQASLEESEAKLVKLNREKDKFFAIIAHDLKSPFNSMLGLLNMLIEDYDTYTDERRKTLITAASGASLKAYELLIDLLEWAKLQSKHEKTIVEPTDINKIIEDNIEFNKREALAKEISIHKISTGNLNVNTDIKSIQTIIRNILRNAIKFTYNGGSIVLDTKRNNGNVEISIKDTGVGMSEETINKLFKLDENVTMPGTNNEIGTGLGLIICHEIVTKNNWEMNIDSQIGKGTTFKILIPAN